ncbi:MAG: hypothetical protein WA893_13690, partial [Xanthobacteraceae bacterium]
PRFKHCAWVSFRATHCGVLAEPTIRARLAALGGGPTPMTSAEFGKFIARETEKWAKVIQAANIKVD